MEPLICMRTPSAASHLRGHTTPVINGSPHLSDAHPGKPASHTCLPSLRLHETDPCMLVGLLLPFTPPLPFTPYPNPPSLTLCSSSSLCSSSDFLPDSFLLMSLLFIIFSTFHSSQSSPFPILLFLFLFVTLLFLLISLIRPFFLPLCHFLSYISCFTFHSASFL